MSSAGVVGYLIQFSQFPVLATVVSGFTQLYLVVFTVINHIQRFLVTLPLNGHPVINSWGQCPVCPLNAKHKANTTQNTSVDLSVIGVKYLLVNTIK